MRRRNLIVGASVALVLVILFQPELRKALEELGQKKIVSSILPFDESIIEFNRLINISLFPSEPNIFLNA